VPSLKSIRVRIASVKSTEKITRAMKLVAAAWLRRAQDAIVAARPYARSLAEAVAEIAARAGLDAHPLLQERPGNRILLVAISSDRGLAGGFNANLFRAIARFYAEKPEAEIELVVLGRKGRDFFRRRKAKYNVRQELGGAASDTALERARELSSVLVSSFMEGTCDSVYLAYNEFKSAVSQRVVIEPFLPIVPPPRPKVDGPLIDFVYEPSKEDLLATLLPQFVESQILRALLESIASEYGAKMTAMENATRNAKEMIARYTLQYNRARQAAITKELMEIVSGAEALKG